MEHLELESSLEILQIFKDAVGPYLKIKVILVDKQLIVRWGLDDFTYANLSKLINTLFPEQFPTERYKCFLSFEVHSISDTEHVGGVTCQFGAQKTRLYFQCSDLYKANLLWLQSIESIEELEHLSWESWIDSYFAIDRVETTEVKVVDATNIRSTLSRLAIILIVVCFIASSSWFGVSYLRHFTAIKHSNSTAVASKPIIHKTTHISNPSSTSPMVINQTLEHVRGITSNPTDNSIDTSTDKSMNNDVNDNIDNDDNNVEVNQSETSTAPTTVASNQTTPTCPEVYELPAGEVALTFDDGPSPYTKQILSILTEYHIHATFFFVGNNVVKWPDAVHEASELGNEIGDHSVDHGNLVNMTPAQQKWEIEYAAQEIETYSGKPVTLFRPPYESFNNTTKYILGQDGMALALWNRDTADWKDTSPAEVIQSVVSQPASGSVFLLHDKLNTMLALPAIIHDLQAQNLRFVVLPTPYEGHGS